MFYNGYEYAPIIVSFGVKDEFSIINNDIQEKFYEILNIARGKINDR